MNYVIISEMRTGSTFLGELLDNVGKAYFNELFTEELCRRSNILPHVIDEGVTNYMLDQVWNIPDSGFKIIYRQATPQVWARLVMKTDLKVIHLYRDDLLEQYASIVYLERVGVSLNRAGQCWGTDGQTARARPKFRTNIDPDHFLAWCRHTTAFRKWVWESFTYAHDFHEVNFVDLFQMEAIQSIIDFLDVDCFAASDIPDHEPTPRPKAKDMITNIRQVKTRFDGTEFEWVTECI